MCQNVMEMMTALKVESLGVLADMPTFFGNWLKTERKAQRLTQEQLGAKVDLTKAQISRIESGAQSTKRATAVRLAEALGVDSRIALAEFMRDAPGLDDADPITYVTDPDAALIVEAYEGASPRDKQLLKTIAEQIRQIEREHTIGARHDDGDTAEAE